jgi:acyl-coenzyme A thioesterase PaaI-like protein
VTAMKTLLGLLPEGLRMKALFQLAVGRVPMMRYVRPRLVELSAQRVVVRVDLSRRTRNLHESMFLGAFSVAADCIAGVFPVRFMFETGHRVPPIVKSTSAQFYKRVSSYAHFTCTQGEELTRVCSEAALTGQRLEVPIDVVVTAPKEFGDEPVARISLLLSIKQLK